MALQLDQAKFVLDDEPKRREGPAGPTLRDYQQSAVDAVEIELEPGRAVMMTLATGGGKALNNDTPIRTTSGWTTMGELKVGDTIYDERGEPTKVQGVFPQGVKDEWAVEFDDESIIYADANHLWVTELYADRHRKISASSGVKKFATPHWTFAFPTTTEEISETLSPHQRKDGAPNHSIPLALPLRGAAQRLAVPPYLLGLWLGDGNSRNPRIYAETEDAEFYKPELERLGETVKIDKEADRGSVDVLIVSSSKNIPSSAKLHTRLRNIRVLNNKHIPSEYLNAPERERLDLLQGLMDSDGYISEDGKAEYTTTVERLGNDVLELALSLGLKANINKGKATLNGRVVSDKFRVLFKPTIQCARLPRKVQRINEDHRSTIKRRYIKSVSPTGKQSEMTCIAVDSPSRLFLAGKSLIPTHNTEIASELALRRERTLFLAPTVVVAEQTAQRFNAMGIDAVAARGDDIPIRWPVQPLVVCTTYASAVRRAEPLLKDCDLVIIDEAHHAADSRTPKGVTKFTRSAKDADCEILGMTATCWRLSKKEGFHMTWDTLVQRESLPQLVQMGWLVPLVLERPPNGATIATGTTSNSLDYNTAEMDRLNETEPIYTQGLIDWWDERARKEDGSRMLTMTYAVSQWHAATLANIIATTTDARVGLMASGLDGKHNFGEGEKYIEVKHNQEYVKLPLDDRIVIGDEACLTGLRNGTLDNVVNVAKAIEGVDVPALDCVLNGRATKSLALYKQLVGRAARKAEGKKEGLVLDATDNAARLDHPMQHHDWSLYPEAEDKEGGSARVRACTDEDGEQCGQTLFTAVQQCPVCGALQGTNCFTCGKFTIWRNMKTDSKCKRCDASEQGQGEFEAAEDSELPKIHLCGACKSPKIKGRTGSYCWHAWSKKKGIRKGRAAFCDCGCNCWKTYETRKGFREAHKCCGCSKNGVLCGCNGGETEVLIYVNGEIKRPWRWVLPFDSAPCALPQPPKPPPPIGANVPAPVPVSPDLTPV